VLEPRLFFPEKKELLELLKYASPTILVLRRTYSVAEEKIKPL
jgi:hypothetical protein